jgi:FSR family fosmidomycin resistance protein-like MFS transporter
VEVSWLQGSVKKNQRPGTQFARIVAGNQTVLSSNKFNLKVLLLLSFGHLVTDIFQGALPVILPFLKSKLSLSYTATGAILLVGSFTSSIIQPVFGYIADRKEKPLLIPLGVLCAGLGFSLLAAAPQYAVVLPLVVISGLGIAAFHPEGFRTAHFFTGERKATGMSIFSVGGNLGFAIGPVLALLIIQSFGFDALPLMILPSALFLAVLLFFWRTIVIHRETAGAAAGKKTDGIRKGRWMTLFMLIAIVIMRSWVQIGLLTYIPFYYIDHLKGDVLQAGTLVSTFLLGGAIGTLTGAPLADRWGHKRYLVLSMFLSCLVMPFVYIAKGPLLFLVLGILGFILISTFSVTVVMAQHLMPDRLGMASGLMVGFAIGSGGICVTLLGVVADHFGVPAALQSIAVLPVVGFLLTLGLKYRQSGDTKVEG